MKTHQVTQLKQGALHYSLANRAISTTGVVTKVDVAGWYQLTDLNNRSAADEPENSIRVWANRQEGLPAIGQHLVVGGLFYCDSLPKGLDLDPPTSSIEFNLHLLEDAGHGSNWVRIVEAYRVKQQ